MAIFNYSLLKVSQIYGGEQLYFGIYDCLNFIFFSWGYAHRAHIRQYNYNDVRLTRKLKPTAVSRTIVCAQL